ncbi:hypothetical protein RRF57_001452 [Xylaria bambusicola]|uniref:Luciferase domain-containing protein n=1 Tax=Xylaria bambusicola TaxID=326684 RepID=A0AAN7UHZ8_9PEZI
MNSQLFWKYFIPVFVFQLIFELGLFVYRDFFILFKDLGLGGSGTTFYGWAVGRLRFYAANADVLTGPRIPQTANPWQGRLNVLPQRKGPRPTIEGCTPQRQVDFPAPPNTMLAIEAMYDDFVTTPETADHITVRTSFLEPGLRALRRQLTIPTNERGGPLDPKSVALNSRDSYGGEIIHAHREGTAHVILHPADVKRVIEGGWGERHPFCASGIRLWLFKAYYNWFHGINIPVPEYLVITYAPRHAEDYAVLRQIIQAAVWYATEGRRFGLDANTYPIPPAPESTGD